MKPSPVIAAIEAGGSKFWVSTGLPGNLLDAPVRVPTGCPEQTLTAVRKILREARLRTPFQSIGIATFGPVGVQAEAPDYGIIGPTPKVEWQGVDYLSALAEFDVPVAVDTDVNAAALAEATLGAAVADQRVVYITVGTGIGGGVAIDGRQGNGVSHPEMGHLKVAPHPEDSFSAGICPFHDACVEGLASGAAIMERWGCPLSDLPPSHPGHRLESFYLAQLCYNIALVLVPDKIVLGGGVMETPGLLEAVQRQTKDLMGGYMAGTGMMDHPSSRIVAPQLAPFSGLVGAGLLAEQCLGKATNTEAKS